MHTGNGIILTPVKDWCITVITDQNAGFGIQSARAYGGNYVTGRGTTMRGKKTDYHAKYFFSKSKILT